jgi:2-amino-4-hydroxy-6-hydroxymethyldihydropteridine diphosphokinase
LGSNIDDRLGHLREGVKAMARLGKLGAISSVYETEPWGYQDPHAYLNMVLELHTPLEPEHLHARIREVEKARGRKVKTVDASYSARELDIDILFYDNQIISTSELIVPHPRIELRKFVLVPMVEVNGLFEHPLSGKNMQTLLLESRDESKIERYAYGV